MLKAIFMRMLVKKNYENLYDFNYNNEADELARQAAGHCSKEELKEEKNKKKKENRARKKTRSNCCGQKKTL